MDNGGVMRGLDARSLARRQKQRLAKNEPPLGFADEEPDATRTRKRSAQGKDKEKTWHYYDTQRSMNAGRTPAGIKYGWRQGEEQEATMPSGPQGRLSDS